MKVLSMEAHLSVYLALKCSLIRIAVKAKTRKKSEGFVWAEILGGVVKSVCLGYFVRLHVAQRMY